MGANARSHGAHGLAPAGRADLLPAEAHSAVAALAATNCFPTLDWGGVGHAWKGG